MTRWEALADALHRDSAVCVSDDGLHHAGYLQRLQLRADGSLSLRFTDRVTVTVPKEMLT